MGNWWLCQGHWTSGTTRTTTIKCDELFGCGTAAVTFSSPVTAVYTSIGTLQRETEHTIQPV